MEPANEPLNFRKRVSIQIAVVASHTLLMAAAIGVTVAVAVAWEQLNPSGRRNPAGMAVFVTLGPAIISGVIYRSLAKSMPSSALTWWLAFLFTLTNFAIVTAIGHYAFSSPIFPGVARFQQIGLILGTGSLCLLISAALFRLGSSPKDMKELLQRRKQRL